MKCHFHLTGILTKLKFLKIIGYLPFLTGIGQKFGPCGISAIFALNFHSGVCITSTFSFKRYIPHEKYEKSLYIDNARFLTFFYNIGPNLVQILPQDHTHFVFFFLLVSNEIC